MRGCFGPAEADTTLGGFYLKVFRTSPPAPLTLLQALILHDDLKARKRVLGRLGYLDREGVVTLKASSFVG